MEEQESRRGDQKPGQDLPGSVSDQNAEEQPSTGGQGEKREEPDRAKSGSSGGSSDGDDGDGGGGGESSEGSQSTGNPDSAG
jgi:hypothetical protein